MAISLERVCPKEESSHLRGTGLTAPHFCQSSRYLKQHHDRPVSREELFVEVWGYAKASRFETRTVDIHMANLRRKIEPNPKTPTVLITVRGEGYRLLAGA